MLCFEAAIKTVQKQKVHLGDTCLRRHERDEEEDTAFMVRSKSNEYWECSRDTQPFFSRIFEHEFVVGIASEHIVSLQEVLEYVNAIFPNTETVDPQIREISLGRMNDLLEFAHRNTFVNYDDRFSARWHLHHYQSIADDFQEEMVCCSRTEEELIREAQYLLSETLENEIRRIFAHPNTQNVVGHPVHYIIRGDDAEFHTKARSLLLEALCHAKRIESQRVQIIGSDKARNEEILEISKGGTICLDFSKVRTRNGLNMFRHLDEATELKQYLVDLEPLQDKILTVIHTPLVSANLLGTLQGEAGSRTFITIREDMSEYRKAVQFLKRQANDAHLPADAALVEHCQPGETYTPSDLYRLFRLWKADRLRKKIYPQYSDSSELEAIYNERKEKKGSAYNDLMELIGLKEVKAQVDRILDFFRAQRIFKSRGMHIIHPTMHMVFSGAPGTAKTTVARLIACILYEEDILYRDTLIEVGRADLVGEYVGQTAPKVREAFQNASGGILFIDEAYSLVDDRKGLYGDEAINAIVQEMENYRNTVVIMAGYTDRMEQFLETNPGLRSRIAAHVQFSNYSTPELIEITRLQAKKIDRSLTPETESMLARIYDRARMAKDFGNGRYVRNMLEHAVMNQATRLVHMPSEDVTSSDIHTLQAGDFDEIQVGTRNYGKPIGFQSDVG